MCVPVQGPAVAQLVVAKRCHTLHSLASEPTAPDLGYTRIPGAEVGPEQHV